MGVMDVMDGQDPQKPMDEVMLAMDVVDTLRRNRRVAMRELESDTQQENLLARLKTIYGAQGIDVSDEILKEGIQALREDRFVYQPPRPSFSRGLAKIYVRRSKWVKPVLGFVLLLALAFGVFNILFSKPSDIKPVTLLESQ